MTVPEILKAMKPLGRESYKRVLFHNYGVKEPCFGVPISELKKFQKRIKKDYQLALALYATGHYDAIREVQQRGSIGKKRKTLKC